MRKLEGRQPLWLRGFKMKVNPSVRRDQFEKGHKVLNVEGHLANGEFPEQGQIKNALPAIVEIRSSTIQILDTRTGFQDVDECPMIWKIDVVHMKSVQPVQTTGTEKIDNNLR